MQFETVQRWLESAKNIAQILALIIAGVWTYVLFIRTEAPSLEYRARTNSELSWFSTHRPEECIARFYVTHENIGTSSYKVTGYRLRTWTFEMNRESDELLRYVDLQDIQSQEPLFDQKYTSGPFVTQFPPNASFRHAFEWVVKEAPNTRMFFRVDLSIGDEGNDPGWHAGSWGMVCKDGLQAGHGPRNEKKANAEGRTSDLQP